MTIDIQYDFLAKPPSSLAVLRELAGPSQHRVRSQAKKVCQISQHIQLQARA